MQDESPLAVLGNMSQGGGSSTDAEVDLALKKAQEAAASAGGVLTVEHLLVALLDEPSVVELLEKQFVDRASLRVQLQKRLESAKVAEVPIREVKPDPALQNVLRRAMMKSVVSNRRGVEGAELVVAMLVEDDSFAATALREHGIKIDDSENAALERYLRIAAEQDRKLAELRRRIANEPANVVNRAGIERGIIAVEEGIESAEPDQGPCAFTLRVSGEPGARFKAAVSHDGRLDLYIESVPFETEFVAGRVAVLFERIDSANAIKVELLTERDGRLQTVAGAGGQSGAIFEDVVDRMRQQRSGRL
jgi:hypothetical protein